MAIIALFASGQTSAADLDTDFGMIYTINVGKQFCKRWNVGMQQNLWVYDNMSQVERYMPGVTLDYSIWKNYLKINTSYYYLYQYDKKYYNRHRYQVGLTGAYGFKHVNLSLVSRFESTYSDKKPNNKWRNRIQLDFIINKDCKWKPFINTDIFYQITGKLANQVDRFWYDAGVEYKIDKMNAVDLRVREEHMIKRNPKKLTTYIALCYKIKL